MPDSKPGKPVLVLSTKDSKRDKLKLDARTKKALRETARGVERMTEPLREITQGLERATKPARGLAAAMEQALGPLHGTMAALEARFNSFGGLLVALPPVADSLPANYRHLPRNDDEAFALAEVLALRLGLRLDEFWEMPNGKFLLLWEMKERAFPERIAMTAPAEAPATTLGEQLRAARKVAGHSQADAAHEIGVDTKTVSGVESGRHTALRNKNAASFRGYIAKYSKSLQTPS